MDKLKTIIKDNRRSIIFLFVLIGGIINNSPAKFELDWTGLFIISCILNICNCKVSAWHIMVANIVLISLIVENIFLKSIVIPPKLKLDVLLSVNCYAALLSSCVIDFIILAMYSKRTPYNIVRILISYTGIQINYRCTVRIHIYQVLLCPA